MKHGVQSSRLLILLAAGGLLAASAFGWNYYRDQKQLALTDMQPPPFIPAPPAVPVSRHQPTVTATSRPLSAITSAQVLHTTSDNVKNANGAIPIAKKPPAVDQPLVNTEVVGKPTALTTPPVTPVTQPQGVDTAKPAPVASDTAVNYIAAQRSELALEAWRKRKKSELFGFLFGNKPSPRTEEEPTTFSSLGRGSFKATTRLEAAEEAKLSLGVSTDPFASVDPSLLKPLEAVKPIKPVDWKFVVAGKRTLPNIPKAPEPQFASVPAPPPSGGLEVPKPPSGSAGADLLDIAQLPVPPSKHTNLDLRLIGIIGDVAIFKCGTNRTNIVLKVGETYDGTRLIRVSNDIAYLDDGDTTYEKQL